MTNNTIIEAGSSAHVEIIGDHVVKTGNWAYDYTTAVAQCVELGAYAHQLDKEPVQVAALRNTGIVPGDEGFYVRHTVDFVPGLSIARLPETAHRQAVAQAIGQVSAMSTSGDPDRLCLGLDAHTRNWIDTPEGPVLIDLYPPLTRKPNGSFELGAVPWNRAHYDNAFGTKTGVVTKLLASSLMGLDGSRGRQLLRLGVQEDWCYDTLPADMHPQVRDRVRRELHMRFVPYLAGKALCKVRDKAFGALC